MRRKETQAIGDVIQEYLKALRLQSKIKEVDLTNQWEEVVGRLIARATQKKYIKDRKFYVHLNSPVIKHELRMIKTEIVRRLNNIAGGNVIDELIIR